jgi:hypothetical protein
MPVSKKFASCELSQVLTPSVSSYEALLSQPVLQVGKQVVVAWSKIRALRRVVKQLPVKMLQQCTSVNSFEWTCFVMEEHYTGCQHSTPFALNDCMHMFCNPKCG